MGTHTERQFDMEERALLRAAEVERALAAELPADSIIRGLFLRNANAYRLAAWGCSRAQHLEVR